MSSEKTAEIRQHLRSVIADSGRSFGSYFRSEEEFDAAVLKVQLRFDYVRSMVDELGGNGGKSAEIVFEYLNQRRQKLIDDSINKIPLNTLVLPYTGRQSAPNGLCALPTRQDTLTGSRNIFPDHRCESDFVNITIEPEWVSLAQPEKRRFDMNVSLRRIKIVQ